MVFRPLTVLPSPISIIVSAMALGKTIQELTSSAIMHPFAFLSISPVVQR